MPQGLQPATSVGIIHLFATGPGIEHNTLVQISAARFSEADNPVQQTWILNPRRHITKRLHEKTGLSNRDCTSGSALAWAKARRNIQSFLRQVDVLFYVDTESRKNWLEDVVLLDMDDPPALVDLATMAHFFLPGKQRAYTDAIVSDLAVQTKLPKSKKSQRALVGSYYLLRNILDALYQANDENVQSIPAVIQFLHYAIFDNEAPADRATLAFAPLFRVALGASRINWPSDKLLKSYSPIKRFPAEPRSTLRGILGSTVKASSRAAQTSAPNDRCEDPQAIKPEYVRDMLDRTIKNQSASWEPRASQKTYLDYCSEALRDGGIHAIEAGTGTGKTLGYLLPACQFATVNRDCQVYIASSTKNLAEQLHDHEWPKLPRDIRAPLTTAILLGKRNYLCRFTVLSYLDSLDFEELSPEGRLAWLHMFMVLRHADGVIEDIPHAVTSLLPDVLRMRAEFNSDAACSRDSCTNYTNCTYASSLREANEANIVFTNHHKLVLQFSAQNSKQAAVFIIDEADLFAEHARGALRATLSKTDVDLLMRNLKGSKKRRGVLDRLENEFNSSKADANLVGSVEEIRRDCQRIEALAFAMGEICADNSVESEVRWNTLKQKDQVSLHAQMDEAGNLLYNINEHLEIIRGADRYEYVDDPAHPTPKPVEQEYRQLSRYLEQTKEWSDLVKQFTDNRAENNQKVVHTLSTEKSKGKDLYGAIPSWNLTQYTFEIGERIEDLLKPRHATIFTSATLYVNQSLDLFKHDLLGSVADQVELEAAPPVKSEFNYREHVMGGMVDLYGQPFNFKWPQHRKRQWHQAMACAIGILSVAMYGRTLVLFTSLRDLNMYAEWLKAVMEEYDVELLTQDGPSYAETELFRTSEHSVLFGVNRFWSGVDFPGQTCSQVIVVRTPNLPFHDPLVKHRQDVMPSNDFWRSYYHPKVRLRFIQQFGRLMRRKTDRGLFITLDSRAKKHFEIFPTPITEYKSWKPVVNRALAHMGFTPEIKARGLKLDQAWRDIRQEVYSRK